MDCMKSFMNTCRLCLKPDQGEILIFSNVPTESSTLYDKINVCLPVRISRNDDLPKKICRTCWETVDLIFSFWQLSSNSEKQLQSMLNTIKEDNAKIMMQDSSMDWAAKDAVILLDTSANTELVIDSEDTADIDDSNIEIREVYFGDNSNQNAYIEEDVDAIEEIPETAISESFGVPFEHSLLDNVTEATSISQIVESSNVSLREWMTKNEDANMSTEKFLDMILVRAEPKAAPSPYTCSKCGEICPNDEKLLEHIRVAHKLHKCLFCNKIFAQKYALENHLYVHTDTRNHLCSRCPLSFKREIDLLNHLKRRHAKTTAANFSCDKCAYTSKNNFALKVHSLGHDGISMYKCDKCGKGFNAKMDLRTHQNNHIGFKPFQCDVCGNSFTRGPYLKQHREMVHENPNSFKCAVCDRGFSLKSTLKNHLKRHTGENKHHTCDICGKTVSSRVSLINHQRIHMGDKRFACVVCGKAYVTKLQVQRHAYVHTGCKPFTCNVCSRKLTTRSNLIKHMQTHRENRELYSCNACSKVYVSKYKLRYHIANNHERGGS